jgi:serine/threonine protein kinase
MINALLDGRYKIVSSLAMGGFGHTYLAEDTKRPGNPRCVVKQLRPVRQDPGTIKIARHLFAKEAETLERLGQHDQIPRLFAYFEEQQEFYLIQEFISGSALTEEIHIGHPWSEERVRQLLVEVLEILTFVHGQGVIHRDIKPANLMRRHADGKMVLIDFGAVKEIATHAINSQGQAASTIAIGTPGYMPLEQFNRHPQFNSDVYALGVVGIQALTGLGIDDLLRLNDPKNPSTGEIAWRTHAQVSPEFAAILDNMVRADYRQRYQTATEALAALRSAAATPAPTTVRVAPTSIRRFPIAIPSRFGKIPKRIGLTVVGGLAALVIGGVGIEVWQSQQMTAQAATLLQQAQAKFHRGNYEAAIVDLNKVLQVQPQNGEAYHLRGNSYRSSFGLDYHERAIADYTQALRYLAPTTPRIGLQFESDSRTQRHTVIRVDPELPAAEAGVRVGDQILAINDQPTLELSTQQVQQLLDGAANTPVTLTLARQGTSDFQVTFNRVLAPNPQLALVYGDRSYVRQLIKDYEGALEDARKAQEIVPHYGLFYYYEGLALAGQGKPQDALNAYDQAIQADATLRPPYVKKGNILRQLNQADEAIDAYTDAIEVDPKFVEAYFERGRTYFDYLNQKQAALEDFTKVIELERGPEPEPNVSSPPLVELDYLLSAYLQRGRAYIDLGNPKAAIEDFDEILKQETGPTDLAYIFRGIARDKLQDYQGAIADFTTVIDDEDRLVHDRPVAYNFRGLTYLRRKDIPSAIQDFTQAIEITHEAIEVGQNGSLAFLTNETPTAQLPSYYLSRGRAYAQQGSRQQAIADLEKAAELAFAQRQLNRYNAAQAELEKLR